MAEFSKILIANRGEIACRIIRSARDLGYRTVAVFSDADADALHVRQADEAIRIGPPAAKESYLNIDAFLAAAKRTGADAVHPGYGFLSENADFARACTDAGLVFIGPPASAIESMGNKAKAKTMMAAAGISCLGGYHGADQSDGKLAKEARRIGFPLMVKAAAGGGGRGMRLVSSESELADALTRARSEAAGAFGSDELILEQAIADARHVEIQVFADQHGNVIHLGERECSIQRRFQKVIEEAPSPAVGTELRARMGETAVAAARVIGYVGAGTIEFLLDAADEFYFLEMNTRLQVEHAVTEAITGVDLVEWQLRIAAGEPLPLQQQDVHFRGHAIEARLYAEDPNARFIPQSGTLIDWRPAAGSGIRIDHGLTPGQSVTPFYDPMLAKVIAWGTTRQEARRRLVAALRDTIVFGLTTNRGFLLEILSNEAFAAGAATTTFIERHFAAGGEEARVRQPEIRLLVIAAALLFEAHSQSSGTDGERPQAWSSTGVAIWPLRLTVGDTHYPAHIMALEPNRYLVALNEEMIEVSIDRRETGKVRFTAFGVQQAAHFAMNDGALHLDLGGETMVARETTLDISRVQKRSDSAALAAPMNGAIVAVLVKPGDRVVRGQRLVVLEAMKMQHEIRAHRDGVVGKVLVEKGNQVASRRLLVELEAEPTATAEEHNEASASSKRS